jgi:8-oxo-dGTP pyrophosphatase MutT (NUDIX family)
MSKYNNVTFPPYGPWDPRLSEISCTSLTPVAELHLNKWFALRNRGGIFTIDHHHPHVVVLPVVENRAFVMVRVKRPILDDLILELPAGAADDGESPEEGAVREFAEETGIHIEPNRLIPMPPLAVMPNRIPKLIYVFRVNISQDEFDGRGLHDDEIDCVELVPFGVAIDRIASGEIYAAASIAIIGTHLLLTHKLINRTVFV